MGRCVGRNIRGERCQRNSIDVCEDCGKLVCLFHNDRDKHECDDSVKGCHSIRKEKTKDAKCVEGEQDG